MVDWTLNVMPLLPWSLLMLGDDVKLDLADVKRQARPVQPLQTLNSRDSDGHEHLELKIYIAAFSEQIVCGASRARDAIAHCYKYLIPPDS